MTAEPVVRVGIAVVEHRGRYVVGTRAADGDLPGKSEFPGGKCGQDESPRSAAVRECREETGLEVEAVSLLDATRHEYDHATVELEFWLCRPFDSVEELRPPFHWADAARLWELDFPAANGHLLALIRESSPFFAERD